MENKKTKLTISGNPKNKIKSIQTTKSKGQKTVFIDKRADRSTKKVSFSKSFGSKSNSPNFKKNNTFNSKFSSKMPPIQTDFERRKLAEQRATKRLKGDTDNKDKKSKSVTKKREFKLTVSRALSDEIETRERSLASVKRARQKELKNANKDENN